MSQAGLKQELLAAPITQVARQSGRYEIGEEQPRAANESHAAESGALRLLEINTLSAEELGWIEARKSLPPSAEPRRGLTSAVFAKDGEDPTFGALQPFYREPTLERVQLQFEDLSLDPSHNPLARSSLLPPPRRALGITRATAIGVGVLALSSVGYLAVIASWGGAGRSTTVMLPARMAKAPHVVTLEVPQETAVNAAANSATPAVAEESQDLPWSTAPETVQPREAARASAPLAPAAVAPGVDLSPGWKRRRLIAWRARVAAVRAASAAPSVVTPDLPTQPSREQIKVGIEAVRAAVQTCAGVLHGTSTVRLTIASTGRVTSATIEGAFAGTPEGSCMARALRSASFARFSLPSLQVTYPFRL
jgi:hypothetical protein